MLTKEKKVKLVKELEDVIKKNPSIVFVNFHGMDVGSETELRKSLREQGVNYKVSRKTLLKRAFEGTSIGEIPFLEGEVAIAYSMLSPESQEDLSLDLAPAREIYNFQKEHKGKLNILGGIFEGKFANAEKMIEIATIPTRDVLLSKLAFLLKSPMQRIAIAISEVSKTKNA